MSRYCEVCGAPVPCCEDEKLALEGGWLIFAVVVALVIGFGFGQVIKF
jgi:hypothetical protein